MILYVCRKIISMDTKLKVIVYLISLFIVPLVFGSSLVPEVLGLSIFKTYFTRKDNIFNVYFVKFAWGWTTILTFPFVLLTSSTYCCGRIGRIITHLFRLIIATGSWYFWVQLFLYIGTFGRCGVKQESLWTILVEYIWCTFGRCDIKSEALSKSACLKEGLIWQGFDISGHSFILIYSSLVLIEEAKGIIGWEGLNEMVRNEENNRHSNIKETSQSPLHHLNEVEFTVLKTNYERYTPYVQGLFMGMISFIVLWDVMLLSTLLYFHTWLEKLLGGVCAISMWYITYNMWYTLPSFRPSRPGEGEFIYMDVGHHITQRSSLEKEE